MVVFEGVVESDCVAAFAMVNAFYLDWKLSELLQQFAKMPNILVIYQRQLSSNIINFL